jgi:ABC-type transport system involved in cytochrome bd biosynthesis fused ATPase/permease subunit
MDDQQSFQNSDIVQAFRQVYMHIVQNVETELSEATDSTVLARISGEINEYQGLFLQVCAAKLCT